MRIKELRFQNYEVIREANLDNLVDFVVIAGPNGVGKTKIKDAIVYIFQHSGNPPQGCSVILEATNPEEEKDWGNRTITLPNQGFLNRFMKPNKRLKTLGKFIHIDSAREIEGAVPFRQFPMGEIGSPDEEDIGSDFAARRVKDRFSEICATIYRMKLKLISDLGQQTYKSRKSGIANGTVLSAIDDPTEKFEKLSGQLLYPKKMAPIEVTSPNIQYFDEDNQLRSFEQLSSGEKEVLVLAFDILLQNPSDCVIVIDEPELHLHPELTFRLLKVLKSIGERNQFFLFTHSTDIISNSFDSGVHFLRPKSRVLLGDQILRIDTSNIGDLKLIPNLREAIGMLSLGKKLLFVEGLPTGIDRNVFATIAKSEKVDLAIISSEGAQNITNLSLIAKTLANGLFGLELFMVRDRDSLTEDEVIIYSTKSNNKLLFLPFLEIENTFLEPSALAHIHKKLIPTSTITVAEIQEKLVNLARAQINNCIARYVANELRFKAGAFDATPLITINSTITPEEIITAINSQKNSNISKLSTNFSENFIRERVTYWKTTLERSIASGWSEDARKLFPGKELLAQITHLLFPANRVNIWQEIINDDDPVCVIATQPLRDILARL